MSDDKRFTQWLQDYEAERMPDDMNLWYAIESQIKPVRRTAVISRVGWLVAVLMIIMTTAGVYALDQIINNQVGDEGMNTVAEQGKVTELYITNDFGGEYELKITLETIYADSNRVFVNISTSGTAPADEPISVFMNPHIVLANGQELPFLGFGGGGGGGGGGNESDRVPFSTSLTTNFDASVIEGTSETLQLTLNVELAYNTAANLEQDPMGMNMLGITTFEVEVPFNNGTSLTPNITVLSEGVEMRLQKVVIAPSLTRLELCYVEPIAPERASNPFQIQTIWLPIMSLSVDDKNVFEDQLIGRLPDDYNIETGCYTYNLTFALNDYVGEWALSIDRLTYQITPPTSELQVALQTAFEEAELPAEAVPEGGYTVDNTGLDEAESMELQESAQAIYQAIYEQWQEKIEGAWTFTFTIPEA